MPRHHPYDNYVRSVTREALRRAITREPVRQVAPGQIEPVREAGSEIMWFGGGWNEVYAQRPVPLSCRLALNLLHDMEFYDPHGERIFFDEEVRLEVFPSGSAAAYGRLAGREVVIPILSVHPNRYDLFAVMGLPGARRAARRVAPCPECRGTGYWISMSGPSKTRCSQGCVVGGIKL